MPVPQPAIIMRESLEPAGSPDGQRARVSHPGLTDGQKDQSTSATCHRFIQAGDRSPSTGQNDPLTALTRPLSVRANGTQLLDRKGAVPQDGLMRDALVVAFLRTPIGKYAGALAAVRPDDLAALVIAAVVRQAGI